ncbi:helix-turn-helix domain-containing protein [Delftia tsuruhatensis]|nr:helix-turn-helix domain-containing protein [Delftia tsuruhatensis]
MKRADAEILTVDDLAELFSCDKETAAARLNSGDLPGVKVGRGWIIPRQALFERLNEKAREEAAARRSQQSAAVGAYLTKDKAQKITPALLPSHSQLKQRGRKRREPPALPPIPS